MYIHEHDIWPRVRQQAKRYAKASEEMARRQNLNSQKRASKRTPKENLRISAGDPEAALGRDKEKVFRPSYDVQLLDDLDSPLILGWQVVAQPNDAGLLGGVLRQAKAGLGVSVKEVVADAGYAGGADLAEARALGATVYAPWQANDYSGPRAGKYYAKEQFEWQPGQNAYLCPQGQRLPLKRSSQQKRSSTRRIELQMYQGDERTCGRFAAREECTPGKGARTISRSEYEEHLEELRERMKGEEALQEEEADGGVGQRGPEGTPGIEETVGPWPEAGGGPSGADGAGEQPRGAGRLAAQTGEIAGRRNPLPVKALKARRSLHGALVLSPVL